MTALAGFDKERIDWCDSQRSIMMNLFDARRASLTSVAQKKATASRRELRAIP